MDSFEFWIDLIWATAIIILPPVAVIALVTGLLSVLYEKVRTKFIVSATVQRESVMRENDTDILEKVKEFRRDFDWRAADRTAFCDEQFSGNLDGLGGDRGGDDRGTDGPSDVESG